MAQSVPKTIVAKVRKQIFAILDERHYLSQSRKENGELMQELVSAPEIGGVLGEYIPKSAIKTYIKDAIINAYSKQENAKLFSIEAIEQRLSTKEGKTVLCVDGKSGDKVFLFRTENGDLIVASIGTIAKWETALRKALEYIDRAKNLPPKNQSLSIYLLISALGKQLPQSDVEHIKRSLSLLNINIEVFQKYTPKA